MPLYLISARYLDNEERDPNDYEYWGPTEWPLGGDVGLIVYDPHSDQIGGRYMGWGRIAEYFAVKASSKTVLEKAIKRIYGNLLLSRGEESPIKRTPPGTTYDRVNLTFRSILMQGKSKVVKEWPTKDGITLCVVRSGTYVVNEKSKSKNFYSDDYAYNKVDQKNLKRYHNERFKRSIRK